MSEDGSKSLVFSDCFVWRLPHGYYYTKIAKPERENHRDSAWQKKNNKVKKIADFIKNN